MQNVPRGTMFSLDTIYKRFIFAIAFPFSCPAAPDTGSKVGHPCDNPSPWSLQTMADVQRVYNPETKCKMKLKKALDMQNQCLIEINMGTMTYKNLTLAQIVQRRSALQAVLISGFTYYVEGKDGKLVPKAYFAELPGLMFRKLNPTSVAGAEVSWNCSNRRCQNPVEFCETLCPTCQAPTRQGFTLVKQANQFCQAHG